LYGTFNYTLRAPRGNEIGLNNFLGERTIRSDTQIFLEKFRPEAAAAAYDFTQISVAGGTLQQTLDPKLVEGNLDIQTIIGMTWPTPVTSFR
jgi:tripeptidyl-peptidase I